MITIIVHTTNKQLAQLPWYWVLPWDVKNAKRVIALNVQEFALQVHPLMKRSGTEPLNFIMTCRESTKAVTDVLGNHGLWDGSMPNFDNLQGCFASKGRVNFLVVMSMQQMFSRTNKIRCVQFLRKLYQPERFMKQHACDHEHLSDELIANHKIDNMLKDARLLFVALDLETTRELKFVDSNSVAVHNFGGIIDLVGITAVYWEPKHGFELKSYTWDFDELWHHALTCKVSGHTVPKVMHNGSYDVKYLWRWRVPVTNYLWDTQYGFQSATPFITNKAYALNRTHAFYCRYSMYWKDSYKERHKMSRESYQLYCARDCHNTAEAALAQLMPVNKQTFVNFIVRFQFMPDTLFASMRGFQLTAEDIRALEAKLLAEIEPAKARIEYIFGKVPGSPKMLEEFQDLAETAKDMGVSDVVAMPSTESKHMNQFATYHPVFALFADTLSVARRNWVSTFIRDSKTGRSKYLDSTFNGDTARDVTKPLHFLFDLNPFGTQSGRLSSKASSFWVGFNGQNAPPAVRTVMRAAKGSVLGSTDAPQSESRATAYLSQCPALINNVESDRDFHKINGSAFFGIPYDEITDAIRDTSKRVNHGANYNMQAFVLLETMGIAAVRRAQHLLNLPPSWSLIKVCVYLLEAFDRTYPEVRSKWYADLCLEVLQTGRLHVPTGYAPLLLENPLESKSALNSAVSLKPQSWSAFISMKGMQKLIQLEVSSKVPGFRYILQLHDENIFSVPIGTNLDTLETEVQQACTNEHTFDWNHNGKPAKMVIPVGALVVGTRWNHLKYDEKARVAGAPVEYYLPGDD